MEPSASNDAATVLSHFRKGVEAKGLPVAVRFVIFFIIMCFMKCNKSFLFLFKDAIQTMKLLALWNLWISIGRMGWIRLKTQMGGE